MKLFSGHLKGLLTFSGRENREPFWLWMLICYVAQTALAMCASIPMWVWMFQEMQHTIATGDPQQLSDPQTMVHDMQPMMQSLGVVSLILGVVFIVFIAAAIARRLHDGNRSGWWALPVLLLNIASQIASLALLMGGKLTPVPGKPFAAAAAGFGPIQFLSLLSIVALIVLLVLPGTPGDNRFGPDPLDK